MLSGFRYLTRQLQANAGGSIRDVQVSCLV